MYKHKYAKEEYNRFKKIVENDDVDKLIEVVRSELINALSIHEDCVRLVVALKKATRATYSELNKLATGAITYEELIDEQLQKTTK